MPKFDYKAAKAAGYTDEQIAKYLGEKRAAGVDVWIDKADYQPSPPTVASHLPTLGHKPAGGYLEGPAHYQENFGGDPLNYIRVTPYNIPLGRGIDAFPAMGGAVFGKALGVPGAFVGGGSMDMLRRSLRGLPIDPRASAIEGVKQGGLQFAGSALAGGAQLLGPAARIAERAAANPVAQGIAKLLPFGGYAGRGLTGAAVGAALPIAGKAAIKVATDPRTEAFLGSMAFRSFARHFPQAANQIVRQLSGPQE